MINYYFKYIEFMDTVFLVLKKRPLCKSFRCISVTDTTLTLTYVLAFLHVFHHSTTAVLAFVGLGGKISAVTDIWIGRSLFC